MKKKKVIDIEEVNIKPLKIAAVNKNMSFKKYLERKVTDEQDSLSRSIIEDGQFIRGLSNYLRDSYEIISRSNVDFLELDGNFKSYEQFIEFVIGACKFERDSIKSDNDNF